MIFAHFFNSCAKVRRFYERTKKNAQNVRFCAEICFYKNAETQRCRDISESAETREKLSVNSIYSKLYTQRLSVSAFIQSFNYSVD